MKWTWLTKFIYPGELFNIHVIICLLLWFTFQKGQTGKSSSSSSSNTVHPSVGRVLSNSVHARSDEGLYNVSLFSVNVLGAQWSENFFGSESFKKRSQFSLLRHLKIFFPVNSKKELGSPHLVPWLVYKIRKSTYYTCIKKLYTFLLNNISLYQQRWSNKLKNNSLKCGFFYTILRFNELDIGIGSLFY